ncbi:MAG TPA: response regulator [Chloroflexota bacterium]|nr:response regulator [Chloroflexota bacterium]
MPTVLVADDVPDVRELIALSLTPGSYTILEATDGNMAWELIKRHRPEVVVLDVLMPGLNGLELTQAIRGDPALAYTYVILLSAAVQPAQVEAGLAAGANRYMTKPFSLVDFFQAVEEGLAQAREARQRLEGDG